MIRIKGGHIVDPLNGRDGPGDLWIDGDRIVGPPRTARRTTPSTRPARW